MKKSYEVTVKVEVHAPPNHSRAVEKMVDSLVGEYLNHEMGPVNVVGGCVTDVQERKAVKKKYHVVLRRVVNIVVDNVEANDPRDAIEEALKQFRALNRLEFSVDGIPIDDGDQFTAALVDEYDEDGENYEQELVFDVEKDGLTFKAKPAKLKR